MQLDSTATLAANPRLRLIFGWAEDTPLADVRPLDADRFVDDQARASFLQQLARDGGVHDYLLRLRRLDGSAMWIEVTARAEPVSTSSTLRLEAMMRDVTERKKLQDQSRDLYQQLAQAEKLAALGQTISGVAHELNNPLGTILACAERLAGRRLDEMTRRDLDAISDDGGAETAVAAGAEPGEDASFDRPVQRAAELRAVIADPLAEDEPDHQHGRDSVGDGRPQRPPDAARDPVHAPGAQPRLGRVRRLRAVE